MRTLALPGPRLQASQACSPVSTPIPHPPGPPHHPRTAAALEGTLGRAPAKQANQIGYNLGNSLVLVPLLKLRAWVPGLPRAPGVQPLPMVPPSLPLQIEHSNNSLIWLVPIIKRQKHLLSGSTSPDTPRKLALVLPHAARLVQLKLPHPSAHCCLNAVEAMCLKIVVNNMSICKGFEG